MRRKKFRFEKYVEYNKLKKKSTCLIQTCRRELAGKSPANIKRHYKLVHRQEINSSDEFEEFENGSSTDVQSPAYKEKEKERASSKLNTPLNRDDFLKCCVGLVTIKNIPLRIFDDGTFFKKLIAPYEQKFNVNFNSNNIAAIIDNASKQIKAEIATLVKNKILCLKIDIASRIENSVLSINIQYINDYRVQTHTIDHLVQILSPQICIKEKKNTTPKAVRNLAAYTSTRRIILKLGCGSNVHHTEWSSKITNKKGMIQTTEGHTAVNLKDDILCCLSEYNISINQIYSITSDNGSNVFNLSKLLQDVQQDVKQESFVKEEPNIDITESDQIVSESLIYEEDDVDIAGSDQIELQLSTAFSIVRCAAHAVQLAASDVIRAFKVNIDQCRKLTKELRTAAREGSNGLTFPSIDYLSSWNSTYNMMDTILCHKEYIENFDNTKNINVNWISVQNFVTAFQPLAKCSLKLQNEQYILGDFFRDWLACKLELGDLVNNNPYAEALLYTMKIRKEELKRQDAFVAGLYLDPRFNFDGTPLLSENEKQVAMDHIIKTHELIAKYEVPSNTQNSANTYAGATSSSTQDDIPATSSPMSAYYKLTQHVQTLRNIQKIATQNVKISIKQKVMKLCEGAMAPLNTKVLDYWQKIYGNDAEMTRLADVILAVPPTQVSVERAFGALSTILTILRSRLSQQSLSNMLIAKLNFEFLDFSTIEME